MREGYQTLNLSLFVVAIFGSFILSSSFLFKKETPEIDSNKEVIEETQYKFGFDQNDYHFEKYTIKPNQILSKFLYYQGVAFEKIIDIEKASQNVFNIRNFRFGKNLYLVHKDECEAPICMVYEPDAFSYVKYDFLKEKDCVEKVDKEIETCVDLVSGEVTSSLWNAMNDLNLNLAVLDKMEDALASGVDFYHAKKNDQFKLIYEKKLVDGKEVGVGKVIGAVYQNQFGSHYAVYYENDRYEGFYDMEGRPTKRAFLRAPVKYSRISSRFNLRRFHPVKKRTIPHFGTDYAAAKGTPIFAVADGVIETASFTKNNGRYVKIKHDKTYKTQYLHMNGFAKGIKKGVRVSQGQTIGYVGQTGLATGPHVCFRFWKNGRQINHLRENFAPKDPLPKEEMEAFYAARDEVIQQLDMIPYVNGDLENTNP